jgi:thiol-disulfide isomerase/thioredoxin
MKCKKVISVILLLAVITTAFAGCGNTRTPSSGDAGTSASDDADPPASDKLDPADFAKGIGPLPEFKAKDLSGEDVDSSLFASNKVTMVNIWGTFCGPCIDEMPDLAAMNKDMPEGAAIVGLVCDAVDNETIDLAKEIVGKTGVGYRNIIPDEALTKYLNDQITAVPTTLFIDSHGHIVGDAIIGSQDAETYMDAIRSLLDNADSAGATETTETTETTGGAGDAANAKSSAPAGQARLPGGSDALVDLSGTVKFTADTVNGDAIDSSIFSGYRMTMINIWGTLCKPCIEEMPDIQKLYTDMKPQKVNIIGFVANSEADRREKAQEIVKTLGVTYPNVIFSDEVADAISAQIAGYPTTIFVDSTGKVIGSQVSGAKDYDTYKTLIMERVEQTAV